MNETAIRVALSRARKTIREKLIKNINMELAKIESLLEVYFDGNATLDEECILREYFSQSSVPVHLQEYKLMFDYFLEKETEVFNQPIQVNTKNKTWKKSWLSIAAAIVLLFTVYKIIPSTNDFTKMEREEAQKAFVESKKAFKLIALSFKRGNDEIAYLENYEVTKNKIFKNNN